MRTRLLIASALAVGMLVVPSLSQAIVISDDFEDGAIGAFPAGWQDVGSVDPTSNAPDPSVTIISTPDASGNPTQAVALIEALAASQGIYQPIPVSAFVAISVDVRVDRVSDIPTSIVTDWPIAATLNQLQGETDLAVVPTMGVYVAGITESWYGFMVGTAGAEYNPDLGTGVALGTWYRVEQRLHTVTGAFEVKISNLETGQVLLDSMDVVPAWTPEDGLFDVVAFFDGEISLSTVSNLAVMDNIWVSDDAVAAAVHAVRSDVDLLLAAGLISERLASSAGGILDLALVKLGQGNTNAASGNLEAAIHMIEAVIGRDIDQADADPIIAALQAVVDSL